MMESVVPEDYEALCRDWTDGPGGIDGWRELLHALGGRVGWWFVDPRVYEDYDGGPMWCFGPPEDCQLSVVAISDQFALYVADTAEEVELDAIGDLVAWLDESEHQYEGISPSLSQMLDQQLGRRGDRR
jgi:hypothetical protein